MSAQGSHIEDCSPPCLLMGIWQAHAAAVRLALPLLLGAHVGYKLEGREGLLLQGSSRDDAQHIEPHCLGQRPAWGAASHKGCKVYACHAGERFFAPLTHLPLPNVL